jgi:hypothetical protein
VPDWDLISRPQLIEENMNCKVGIVSYSLEGLNNYYCSPNKLYEYAQLNMPMIFSSQPFLVKISRKYRIGEVFYENMSYERRSEIILEMIDNLGYYQKNMNMFLNDYSFDNEMSKLKNAIKDLLNNNSN